MLEFEIPDSRNLTPRNIKFLRLMEDHPEMFYDDFKIVQAYGCPEGSIWNGGRYNPGEYSINMVNEMLDVYDSYGVKFAFTFTNLLLEKVHMYDTYSNMIAKKGNRPGNSVISATQVMTNWIRENYSNYNIVESITQKLEFDELCERSADKITVVPVTLNKDFDKLSRFRNPENLMILVNEPCVDNCPYKKAHYWWSSKMNLYLTDCNFSCKSKIVIGNNLYDEIDRQVHAVHREDIQKYLDLGINKFKISGRCDDQEVSLHTMLHFFVKPEFREYISAQVTLITMQDWNWNWVPMFRDAV